LRRNWERKREGNKVYGLLLRRNWERKREGNKVYGLLLRRNWERKREDKKYTALCWGETERGREKIKKYTALCWGETERRREKEIKYTVFCWGETERGREKEIKYTAFCWGETERGREKEIKYTAFCWGETERRREKIINYTASKQSFMISNKGNQSSSNKELWRISIGDQIKSSISKNGREAGTVTAGFRQFAWQTVRLMPQQRVGWRGRFNFEKHFDVQCGQTDRQTDCTIAVWAPRPSNGITSTPVPRHPNSRKEVSSPQL
jgi:hypothetical protein